MNAVQRPVDKSKKLLSCVESTSLVVPQVNDDRCAVISSTAHSASEHLPATYKNQFFSRLGLTAARSSVTQKQSEVVECDVIVIDDDEDDEQIPRHQDCCIANLFGSTRSLRSDVEANATSRLAQPWSRLRKLLSIDISSPLGLRTLKYVTSTLRSDVMPLNPYTVSHSLAGSDNALDYGTFCRTPVKGKFSGRLRHREYPVKYRHSSAGSHYHYYCFGRADRRRFCRRFDTGLSGRSRRLRRMYDRCSVAMLPLTADEITDWRSSQRLRDYVKKMEEKEKAAAVPSSSHDAVVDVICLSSDSEDELQMPVKRQKDLMFRCHQCDLQLPCDASFRRLIRKHYSTCHGITDIDIVDIPQSDGSVTMQVVHVPQTSAVAPNCLTVSQSTSDTGLAPAVQHDSSLYLLQPRPRQSPTSPASHSVPAQSVRGTWPSCNSTAGVSAADQMQANTHTNAPSQLHSLTLTQLNHVQSCEMISARLPLVNGGDAVNKLAASSQPSCDADVIYLD